MKKIYNFTAIFCVLAFLTGAKLNAQSYCPQQATSTADDEIFNVSIGTLNNSSNCTTTGGPGSILSMYSNYTNLPATNLISGMVYTLSVTGGQCSGFAYSGNIYVWIDYNNNGLFTDPGEQVFNAAGVFAVLGTVYTNTVLIPLTATFATTRMRVTLVEGSVGGPCTNFTWGEVEDYNVNIISNTPCAGTPVSNTVVPATYSTCPILLNPNLSLSTSYTVGGITYQWQSSTVSPVGPYTPIANSTLQVAPVPTLNTTTWYQAVITCTNSAASFTTGASQFFVAGTTTNSVPYFEGFESIQGPNRLPNCSWAASNLNSATQTYTAANTNNRLPRTGSDFAAFQNVPTGTNYFYSNGIQLEPGITYSANLWYQTEYFGFTNWTNLSLLFGANQTPTGLTQIAAASPAVSGPYKALGGTFTVATSGLYYLAIRATSSAGNAIYLSWDDLSVTIPCTPESGNTPTLTLGVGSSTVCAGSQVNLNASGAAQYSWNTGNQGPSVNTFPAQTTTYIVVGTNTVTSCSASQSVIVYVNPSPNIIAIASSASICPGETAYLTGIGATTYAWSNGSTGNVISVSPTSSTTYSLIASNAAGCASSATVQVAVKAAPVIIANSGTTGNACAGDNVQLTAGGGATYQWLSSSSANLLNGSPINVRLTTSTTFTVIGTGANGCSAKAVVTQNVDACTGVSEAQALLAGVRVYPNPTNGVFTVELKAGSLTSVVISDITGRKVLEASGNTSSAEVDLTELANGVYYAAVASENGTAVVRIVKN